LYLAITLSLVWLFFHYCLSVCCAVRIGISITFSLLLSICLLCNRNWYEIEELSVNGYRIFARRNI
ncbi:hypothetical protein OZD66_04270, partial [Wolbachia endosymbiont of Drosophila baimaii]|uniref:hypothetical protein n=1 Tax=Wolbachia endosymbiont of Drosophila baimaii TaxID=375917 RepID=UPI0023A99FB6